MARRGRDVYEDLDRSLTQARGEVDRAGTALQKATAEIEKIRADEVRELSKLAGVRLGELEAHRITEGLDRADRRALQLLERKRAAIEGVARSIAESERLQQELAAERTGARQARDRALATHDEQVEATRARVSATEEHEFQSSRVEAAVGQASRAEEKAQQAEVDRREKGRSYEESKLFSYLWDRRYRFPEYRANRVSRALDDWVAGLCRYERYHRDYAMLLEIPKRLRSHADQLRQIATTETEALQKIERDALAADGVPALAEALESREAELAAIEKRIDEEEQRHAGLVAERAVLESGRDDSTVEALTTLGLQLESEDVATLRADAARTDSREDDALVANIASLRSRSQSLQAELEPLRDRQRDALSALRNLEDLRRRFRQHGYDAADSVFDSSFDISDLLGGLLRGALVGDVWGRLGRHQRFRRRSSSSSSTGWSVLGSVLSSGGGGGFGGGGFSTGGGFGGGGGGGFSTGGGF